MIRLLCFDLDGTLVDSARDIANAVNRTLTEFGKDPLPYGVIVSHIGEGLKVLLQGIFPAPPAGMTVDQLVEHFLRVYEEEMLKTTVPFEGVTEFLDEWTRQGGQIAIITNKNEAPAKVIVKHLGMDRYPWIAIFGADTLPERKPSALPLNTMMKLAGVKASETLMIGDGTPDMVSARTAGVASLAINFGYTTREILSTYHPDGYLNHYSELADWIRDFSGPKTGL